MALDFAQRKEFYTRCTPAARLSLDLHIIPRNWLLSTTRASSMLLNIRQWSCWNSTLDGKVRHPIRGEHSPLRRLRIVSQSRRRWMSPNSSQNTSFFESSLPGLISARFNDEENESRNEMKFLSYSRSESLDLAIIALYNGWRSSGFARPAPPICNSQQQWQHGMVVKRISVRILPRVPMGAGWPEGVGVGEGGSGGMLI